MTLTLAASIDLVSHVDVADRVAPITFKRAVTERSSSSSGQWMP
jgi:hypothetical protein